MKNIQSYNDYATLLYENISKNSKLWVISICILLLLIVYIVYHLIRYNTIRKYSKKLSYEIQRFKHNYSEINNLLEKLILAQNKGLYIFRHKKENLLVSTAKFIIEFKTDLNYLHTCISCDNYNSSNKIIAKYKNLTTEAYLKEEILVYNQLCNEYKQKDIKLKKEFIAEVEALAKKIQNFTNPSLNEVESLNASVLKIIKQSKAPRYIDYETNVKKIKVDSKNLLLKVQKRKDEEKHKKQQAVLDTKIKSLISNLTNSINLKDVNNADKTREDIDKVLSICENTDLIQEYKAINLEYIKQKQKGILVFEKECYVNYALICERTSAYPIIRPSYKGCIVWPHRRRQIARRGYTEVTFQQYLTGYLSHIVSIMGDVNILPESDCKPYEPDIAIVDLNSGCNLRIDIEIDEPYAGLSNIPTHYVGCSDEYRDSYLNQLGWIVVRFSERQIHTQPLNCIALICRIIDNVISNANIDESLLSLPDPKRETLWTQIDAQKWAQEKLRQKYLEHEFGAVQNGTLNIEDIKLSTFEQSIKDKVNIPQNTIQPTLQTGYNKENKAPQDDDIRFDETNHTYSYRGIAFKAVSTIINELFPIFDLQYWAERKAAQRGITTQHMIEEWEDKGNISMEIGRFIHSQIENYYLKKPVKNIYNYTYNGIYVKNKVSYDISLKEFQYFLNFVHDKRIKPHRTEWRIFCKHLKIAGTIDLIAKNGNEYDIYDWKRSDKIIDKDNPWRNGLGELSHLQDTKLNHYKIQQNLYRWILEKEYNITINNMYLVILHPTYDNYRTIKIPRMNDEIKYIISNL